MSLRYFFNRDGAIVCGRDTLQEALDYAKSRIGWDCYLGNDIFHNSLGGSHCVTYKVEEHNWDGKEWRRTFRDVVLTTADAVSPFADRKVA